MALAVNGVRLSSRELQIRQRYLREQNKLSPLRMSLVDPGLWPASLRLTSGASPCKVFRSKEFLAQLFCETHGARRLSICRSEIDQYGDWRADIKWEELMRVKDESGFADTWAVEIYPSRKEVVNVSNMRHLWLLEYPPPYAWQGV